MMTRKNATELDLRIFGSKFQYGHIVITVTELQCHKNMSRSNVNLIEHAFFCNLPLLTPDLYSKSEIFDALFTFIAVHLLYQFFIPLPF